MLQVGGKEMSVKDTLRVLQGLDLLAKSLDRRTVSEMNPDIQKIVAAEVSQVKALKALVQSYIK